MFSVANLEEHLVLRAALPWVARDEMEICEVEVVAVVAVAGICVGYIDNVARNVLVRDKPWATVQTEALALADGMKPIAVVTADDAARFLLNDVALLFAKERAQIVVVIDFAQETDALTVASMGRCKVFSFSNVAHLFFE